MKIRYKKILLAVVTTVALCCLILFTASCFTPHVDIVYEKTSDGQGYVLTKCNSVWGGKLENDTMKIPSTYNGLPVVGIGEGCFAYGMFGSGGCFVRNIYLPSTLKFIGSGAFKGRASTNVYIEDMAAWLNIDFQDEDSNPLSRFGSLYLNGELVEDVVIPDTVTQIKNYAFCRTEIKSITFNDKITSIGDKAFYSCEFIKSIDLPESVETIGEKAFERTAITQVVLGKNLVSIGEEAFVGCYHLVEVVNRSDAITVTKGSEENGCVGEYAVGVYNSDDHFEQTKVAYENGNCVYLGDSCKYLVKMLSVEGDPTVVTDDIGAICTSAFRPIGEDVEIKTVKMGASVIITREGSFWGVDNLIYTGSVDDWCGIDGVNNITFDSVDEVVMPNLKDGKVEIPKWITEIPRGLFKNNSSVKEVVLHNEVTIIGTYAFYKCINLKTINFPNKLKQIKSWAFKHCHNLSGNIVLPEGLVVLGESVFSDCTSITGVVIPGSVSEIKDWAFDYCTSLKSVKLSEGLKRIGYCAFSDCVELKGNFSIPSTVYFIHESILSRTGITSITFKGTVAQWGYVQKHEQWNWGLDVDKVVCSDGIVQI